MNPRQRLLVVLCLVGGGLASVAPAASATDPTCDGRPATIVGTGGTVTGTNGDDVIVATDAYAVDALGGDDVVCAHDVMDTYLGSGDDTYLGTADEKVSVDDDALVGADTGAGTGHDVVRSTAPTTVVVVNGTAAQPDTDQVTGPHLQLQVDGPTEGSYTSRGAGHLVVDDGREPGPPQPVDIDVPHGSLRYDGHRATIYGFTVFAPDVQARSALTFRGSSADETLILTSDRDVSHHITGPLRVTMGGGDDEVDLDTEAVDGARTDNVIRGGTGHDVLSLFARHDAHQDLVADLARGRTTLSGVRPMTTSGFEGLWSDGQRDATVIGTSGPNDIFLVACSGRVDARGGDDLVRTTALKRCARHRTTFDISLGPGDDRASGSGRADTILGGPGHDVVHGGGGRDTCVAEVATSCERR